MNIQTIWKTVIGALGGALAYALSLLGGMDAALSLLFTAMALDYIAGLLTAISGRSDKTSSGRFSSSAAFRGLTKKLLMLVLVALAVAVDALTGASGVCRCAVIGFYVANEGLSIIENAALLGVPFPQALLDALDKLKGGDKTR